MSIFKRVAVGLSGGVDSAVAALLLKNMGFDVIGVFMKNWDLVDESGCCNQDEDLKFVKEACEHLNIEFHEVNFVKEYWNSVFVDLLADYEGGLTPNPDILCNKFIKFDSFLNFSCSNLGADAIATGHYANNSFGKYLGKYTLELPAKLLKAKDPRKDQTFFLSQMPQEALRRTMFPLGDMLKEGVKKLATENGFSKIANRKESMGICFIGSRNFKHFMREYVKPTIGQFIDIDTGIIVGEHQGKHTWTVGQRCRIGGKSDAYYIALKNTDQDIFVCKGHNHPALFSDIFLVSNPFWIAGEPSKLFLENLLNCSFRFQHGKPLTQCSIFKIGPTSLWIRLAQPLRALTPGQYAVFYKDDECLGSARIVKPVASKFINRKC